MKRVKGAKEVKTKEEKNKVLPKGERHHEFD